MIVDVEELAAAALVRPRRRLGEHGYAVATLVRLVDHPAGRRGLVILAVLVLGALLAPWIAPHDPIAQYAGSELVRPFSALRFPLGTDELGRDVLSRLLYASRSAFVVGGLAVAIGAGLGMAAGLAAGYIGGALDALLMRACDVLITFPSLLLALAILLAVGPGPFNIACALAVSLVPGTARLLRAQVLTQRDLDYVVAARASGLGPAAIALRHVLPNAIAPLLVTVFIALGMSVVADAGLSFLGLGWQPPTPTWGAMLNASRAYLRDAWWYLVAPAGELALLVYSLNSISDALRDALDPRQA